MKVILQASVPETNRPFTFLYKDSVPLDSLKLFDERTGAINYNYIRPYLPNQMPKPGELKANKVSHRLIRCLSLRGAARLSGDAATTSHPHHFYQLSNSRAGAALSAGTIPHSPPTCGSVSETSPGHSPGEDMV